MRIKIYCNTGIRITFLDSVIAIGVFFQNDNPPVDIATALTLAAIRAYITWGQFDEENMHRYTEKTNLITKIK